MKVTGASAGDSEVRGKEGSADVIEDYRSFGDRRVQGPPQVTAACIDSRGVEDSGFQCDAGEVHGGRRDHRGYIDDLFPHVVGGYGANLVAVDDIVRSDGKAITRGIDKVTGGQRVGRCLYIAGAGKGPQSGDGVVIGVGDDSVIAGDNQLVNAQALDGESGAGGED